MKRRFTLLLVLLAIGCNTPTAKTESRAPSAATTSTTVPPAAAPSPAASTPAGEDAVDRLVARLSQSPMWNNGTFPRIELPRTATTSEVVAAVLKKVSFDSGPAKTHRIVGTRSVTISPDPMPYDAVLLETDQGRKIMLLRYDSEAVGWWSRVFDR